MIAIKDIAHVRYQARDLDEMERFLLDFGLRRSARTDGALYMRGAGGTHHIHVTELGETNRSVGFAVHAQRDEDLETIAGRFDVEVEQCAEPGGGRRVRLIDPAGFLIDIIYGQELLPGVHHRDPVEINNSGHRPRLGKTIRTTQAPSVVTRLGHVVLLVPNFQKSFEFYRDVLGLRSADSYFAHSADHIIATFMRCGLGDIYTDHHTVALIEAQDGVARFDHCAFEVLDMDDLMQGHAHLVAKGHAHAWGVGRHIQGSQVFDYWRDPFGNKIEHWTDGDLVNDSTPAGTARLGPDELKQWAPALNPEFFG